MNIAWLWHYTESSNIESLRIMNEKSAFIIYARWRIMLRWTGYLYTPIRLYLQKCATHRTLMALPDYLLTDIGMYRSGNKIAVEVVSRTGLVESTSIKLDRYTGCQCIAVPAVPAINNCQFAYQPANRRLESLAS